MFLFYLNPISINSRRMQLQDLEWCLASGKDAKDFVKFKEQIRLYQILSMSFDKWKSISEGYFPEDEIKEFKKIVDDGFKKISKMSLVEFYSTYKNYRRKNLSLRETAHEFIGEEIFKPLLPHIATTIRSFHMHGKYNEASTFASCVYNSMPKDNVRDSFKDALNPYFNSYESPFRKSCCIGRCGTCGGAGSVLVFNSEHIPPFLERFYQPLGEPQKKHLRI